MIYLNFLLFSAFMLLFLYSPVAPHFFSGGAVTIFLGYSVVLLLFWNFNRYGFTNFREAVKDGRMPIGEIKKKYYRRVNLHIILALLVVAFEIFVLDFKSFVIATVDFGLMGIVSGFKAIPLFLPHLLIVWSFAQKAVEGVRFPFDNEEKQIRSELRLFFAGAVPWVLFLLMCFPLEMINHDFLANLEGSYQSYVGFVGLFLIVISIFTPSYISLIWELKDRIQSELEENLTVFSRSLGVRLKAVRSWDALDRQPPFTYITGIFSSFRRLFIAPVLTTLLDKDELMGLVASEAGHVKKKHFIYYRLFFAGFVILGIVILEWVTAFNITILPVDVIFNGTYTFISGLLSLLILTVLSWFIFRYFKRDFQRQADIYCFQSGVNPNHLVNSFRKLAEYMGEEDNKSCWFHCSYNYCQRIAFLQKCMENPGEIIKHDKKVKRSLKIFAVLLVIFTIISFYKPANLNSLVLEEALAYRAGKESGNPKLHYFLGRLYYKKEKWEKAEKALKKSLHLDHNQPDVLDSLARMYLLCPDKRFLNPSKALVHSKNAVLIKESGPFYDTLAEAYFRNSMYKEAYEAAVEALFWAKDDLPYYQKRHFKMFRYLKQNEEKLKL